MKVKVVTFNLRMNTYLDVINYFFNRAPLILERINKEKPDIIGFQEATQPILEWLKATLTEYTLVGIGRSAEFKSEANPIAFRKDRFELFSYQQFWLSPTPEVPGTRYEQQSRCPRICCAAKIREIGSTEVIRFYNTHLDHEGENARLFGMNQIVECMEEDKQKSSHPIILTGDMNAYPHEPAIKAVYASTSLGLKDASENVICTFHAFSGGSPYETGRGKIDYIFTDMKVADDGATAWEDCVEGRYLSDHYPVCVTLETETE